MDNCFVISILFKTGVNVWAVLMSLNMAFLSISRSRFKQNQIPLSISLTNVIVLYCIALHCTALHCTALHCTALHCTALHCTALYCTVWVTPYNLGALLERVEG